MTFPFTDPVLIHLALNIAIGLVWLINGLYCKVLDRVPRHRAIVARILGERYSGTATKLIGVLEIAMAVWVFSGFEFRINAVLQALIILTMNVIEFIHAPDLLLYGRNNLLVALVFIGVILMNAFLFVPLRS